MNTMSVTRAWVALALASLPLGGCFRYVPTDLAEVRPEQRVRVEVTDDQLGRVRAFADVREGTVTGRFQGATADSVTLVLETPVAFQEIALPRSAILGSTRREVDHGRSAVLSGVIVGGIGLLAYLGFEGRGSKESSPGQQVDESRITLFRLGFPF